MTLGSLPILYNVFKYGLVDWELVSNSFKSLIGFGFNIQHSLSHNSHTTSLRDHPALSPFVAGELGKVICAFFITYCISDLLIGVIHYKSQITFLTGWFHHTLYFFLVSSILTWNFQGLFALYGILELPTLLLGLGSIQKAFRHDMVYGAIFFSTRIVFHLFLAYRLFVDFNGSRIWTAAVAVFPLHILWFNQWIQQQRRLRRQRISENVVLSKSASSSPSISSAASNSTPQISPSIMERIRALKKKRDLNALMSYRLKAPTMESYVLASTDLKVKRKRLHELIQTKESAVNQQPVADEKTVSTEAIKLVSVEL
ncbi:hypothetical protein HK098_008059 [Nowakowskiella sp. JEL0407]|nr:hypothetical protein HK098_008059 [Nowakowskiella sp. JEL0407]